MFTKSSYLTQMVLKILSVLKTSLEVPEKKHIYYWELANLDIYII